MNVVDQIKELEKQAKEAKYWKDRYDELNQKVKSITQQFNGLVDVKVPIRQARNYSGSRVTYKDVADSIYAKLQSDDELEIRTTDIEKELAAKGLSTDSNSRTKVRQLLLNMSNILVRQDGITKILYYFKPSSEQDEISSMVPKKFSHMG